ncbi:hypothetical protein FO519_002329 [Halicephalobus sp. NKZ332]|nr:hypothetical protein FO519_002329 [Halicephalobus sp. NKZ332]
MNNPFNDSNLTDAFVWNKKLEREGLTSLSKKELNELHQDKVRKNLKEMDELRRNRQARQSAKEDLELMTRERDRQMYGDYTMVEYKFHIKQARERTKIRIRENRPKPIDLLVRYSVFGVPEEEKDYDEFELVDPLTYIKNISIDDLEDLIADMKTYKKIALHKDDAFWDDMTRICEGELEKLKDIRKRKEMDEAVHSSVRDDVLSKFKGKSYKQLSEMEKSLKGTIEKNPGNGFFQAVLDQLHPYMAKQRIKERHKEKMALKLQRIREEQAREMAEHQISLGDIKIATSMKEDVEEKEEKKIVLPDVDEIQMTAEDATVMWKKVLRSIPFTLDELLDMDEDKQEQEWSSLNEAQLKVFTSRNYELGRYSPVLDSDAMPGIEVIDEKDDKKELENQRKKNRTGDGNQMTAEEADMIQAFKQGMEKDEEEFAEEEKIEKQTFLWSDKYRPRKPRYFNRVHTGFDWNKYNQTHYDLDNPPPKVVQGYRFNIFYPDLLDVTNTPSYNITECEDPDFAILRFKAGPPYEDIAFKIVNREMVRGQRRILKPPQAGDKQNSLTWWNLLSLNNFPLKRITNGIFDPTDNEVFKKVVEVHWIIEIAICYFIIKVRAYTEIDWSTYMQQTELFLNGERNYSKIDGDTGPVVYPAGHLWLYSLFYYVTNEGKNIIGGQICFLYVYLLNQIAIYWIYGSSLKIPPYVVTLITFLSYRLHSIYVLRMFNDTLAMLFCNFAMVLMICDKKKNNTILYLAMVLFSLGVGVKMNILLFAPAIALIVFFRHGLETVFKCGIVAGLTQIILGLPFLISYPKEYIFNAFNFGRVFLYKWTVFDRETKRKQRNWAVEQKDFELAQYLKEEVGYRTADKVFDLKKFNDVVLDLGCGTGFIGPNLIKENVRLLIECDISENMIRKNNSKKYEMETIRIVGDEEKIPIRNESVDLVISSLAGHWINDIPRWFRKCFEILRKDGVFIGSVFFGDTLYELRVALQLAENERLGGMGVHVSPFIDAQDVGGLLSKAGFDMITMDSDEIEVGYPNVFALLYDLQLMAESNSTIRRTPNLRRDVLIAADSIYREMFGKEGRYPATFQFLNFIAWRPGPSMPKAAKRGSQNVSFKDLGDVIENPEKYVDKKNPGKCNDKKES